MYNKNLKKVFESRTVALDTLANELKTQGKKVINLTAGQLDFPTPASIIKAGFTAAKKGQTKYTNPIGTVELRQAIARKLKKDNNLDFNVEQIAVCAGAKQALYNTFQVLLNRGDEVIIPIPAWVSYVEQVKMAHGRPVLVEWADIPRAITKKTKAVIVNSPRNPDGKVFTPREARWLAKHLRGKDIWLISDDVYEYFVYTDKYHSPAEFYKKSIVVNAVSKSYAMTGWRLGYVAGPADFIKEVKKMQSHSSGNPCSISQAAALHAMDKIGQPPAEFVRELKKRRAMLAEELGKVKGLEVTPPDGAFYFFVDIRGVDKDSVRFCECLLKEALVAVVPGRYFFKEGFIRISYAASTADLEEAVERIRKFVERY